MADRTKISLRIQQGLIFGTAFLVASSVFVSSPSFAQEEEKKGFFGKLFDSDERKRRKAERKAAKAAAKRKEELSANAETTDVSGATRTELIKELKDAKQELKKRNFNNERELAEAKAELARRQSTGQITPEQVKLTPARIRDQQLSELEKLKAELARRKSWLIVM